MTPEPPTRLAALLHLEGRKQNWLASQLGVSRQMVGKWVSGSITPGAVNQGKIAAALGRTRADVFPQAQVVQHPLDDERKVA